MKHLAEKDQTIPSTVSSATVRGLLEKEFILQDERGRIRHARRAFSCLVQPQKGDVVLFSHRGDQVHILAILERQETNSCQLQFDGDVTLSAADGALDIIARDGMKVGSPRELAFFAPRMEFGSDTCEMSTRELDVQSDGLRAGFNTVKFSTQKLQSFVGNAVQNFVTRYTRVEGLDQLNARSIRNVAKDILSLKSKFAFVKAKKNVKIDGKQIFMG